MADVEAPQIDTSVKKRFMYMNRKGPYGTIYALEALEVVLISAAFEATPEEFSRKMFRSSAPIC